MSRSGDAYHWLRPDVEDGPRLGIPDCLKLTDACRGRWLDCAPDTPFAFTLDKLARPPPNWIGDRIPLVSEYFLSTLKRAGVDNYQAIPALLGDHASGESWSGYFVFNVIGLVDGADSEASVGTELMGEDPGPKFVEYAELVLSRARTRDLDMFRLADSPGLLLVHDRVMRIIAAAVPNDGWGFTAIEIEVR